MFITEVLKELSLQQLLLPFLQSEVAETTNEVSVSKVAALGSAPVDSKVRKQLSP